jgi:hypothetical protein
MYKLILNNFTVKFGKKNNFVFEFDSTNLIILLIYILILNK